MAPASFHIHIPIRIRPLRLCFVVLKLAVTKGVDRDVDGGVDEEDGAISACCGTFEDAVPGEQNVGMGFPHGLGLGLGYGHGHGHGHSHSRAFAFEGNIRECSHAHSMTTTHSESLSISSLLFSIAASVSAPALALSAPTRTTPLRPHPNPTPKPSCSSVLSAQTIMVATLGRVTVLSRILAP
jgi:hypothetical protein